MNIKFIIIKKENIKQTRFQRGGNVPPTLKTNMFFQEHINSDLKKNTAEYHKSICILLKTNYKTVPVLD